MVSAERAPAFEPARKGVDAEWQRSRCGEGRAARGVMIGERAEPLWLAV